MAAEKKTPGEVTGGANYMGTTSAANSSTCATGTDTPATSRTCSSSCWCHVGYLVTYNHRQYMDSLAREIRALEISEGVLAL